LGTAGPAGREAWAAQYGALDNGAIVLKGMFQGCWHADSSEVEGLNSLDCHAVVAKLIAMAV
jgi:hypothetical protein